LIEQFILGLQLLEAHLNVFDLFFPSLDLVV
jgi:hypothetical protein